MKKCFISAGIVMAAICVSCSGSKTQNEKVSNSEDLITDAFDEEFGEEFNEDFGEEIDEYEAPAEDEFVVKPLSTDVEGPLAGIVTISDKPYKLKEGSGLGEKYYALHPEFEIVSPQKINGTIDIKCTFYDENGQPINFEYDGAFGPYTSNEHHSFSAGLLQMAIAKNKTCEDTSVLIRTNNIKNFTPEMLKAIKSFKIVTMIDNDEFDYDSDLYD